MGVNRCRWCSGLILPDFEPKVQPSYHAKCYEKLLKIEEELGYKLGKRDLAKRAKNDRYDYVLEQLNMWGELPWGYSQSWGSPNVRIVGSDGIPDAGLDNIERGRDIEERVDALPKDEWEVITKYYKLKWELKEISREMGILPYRADWLKDKAIKRMGAMC